MRPKHLALSVLATGAALAATGVHAQSSVTLYGLIDMSAPQYATHADANGHNVFGFGNNLAGNAGEPWFSGSRWGVRGSEDLGNGLNAIFTLESEYVVANGAMEDPGQIFDRDAWVGLQDNDTFGKLTFGFQNTVARDASASYGDPYGSPSFRYEEGGWTNANNFKQMIFYAGSANGATRYSNGIAWKKIFSNGLFASAGYAFGNQAGNFAAASAYQAAAGYNGGALNLAGFYSHTDSLNSTLNQTFSNNAYSVGGNYTFGILRANAGYFHYSGEQPAAPKRVDNAWTVSFKLSPKGALDYELGFQQMYTKHALYNVDGDIANANNDSSFEAGGGLHDGHKDTLYASVFYHLSKRTEVYVAGDYMKLHGDYTVPQITDGSKNQVEATAGIRTRF